VVPVTAQGVLCGGEPLAGLPSSTPMGTVWAKCRAFIMLKKVVGVGIAQSV
jgi:hypothetical protein